MLICVDTELGAHVCAEGTSSHPLHEVVADVCADDACNVCSVECILGGILVATRSLWTPLAASAGILLCGMAEFRIFVQASWLNALWLGGGGGGGGGSAGSRRGDAGLKSTQKRRSSEAAL